jgi:hypothetical protein
MCSRPNVTTESFWRAFDREMERKEWEREWREANPLASIVADIPIWLKTAIIIGIGAILFGLGSGANPFGG